MITSFFRTSKPLHYLIFLVLFFAIFVFQSFYNHNINQSPISYLTLFGVFFLFLVTFFVYVFIITKNDLTQKNSFAALYLCLFIGILPQFFLTPIVMLSNLFVLLGLRRIFSLKKNLNTKKKLFDAGFWIALATIFYPWSVLYFVPLFVAILMITSDYFKNTFAVFFGALSVSLTAFFFIFFLNKDFDIWLKQMPQINLDLSIYYDLITFFPLAILLISSLWGISSLFNKMVFKTSKSRFVYFILFSALVIGLIIPLVSENKSMADFIFLVFPLAIVMANNTEQTHSQWLPSVFILLLFGTAVLKTGLNIQNLLNF
ncbi:hypothetical protein FORMA_12340 [Formosa sp. Hel3_A1_48]|uniref:DUF6427 family protein n=1 Tax=Formosa sp. Hel3_A1_48 TaxID=1336795 RepID=UPI00084E1C1A|nr:DUF6427 family protein [Formosa sp. Hel3_A1_48]AOR26396.1 hypothetical protein FORMA_12340 [Formosa sp. Hel3_A1_48]MDC0950092.1 DUF6427 family protein [Flavobacteriaceae bacterium]